ncbi:helix-turn-helix domain-containing protein [Streptomyces sp. NPDC003278]|uniref:helix-turn-helix domain-containing protein n=1 Tax=Streptomyces sp. NPDC003278 TaxID=3364679 RepID=UPI0036A22985
MTTTNPTPTTLGARRAAVRHLADVERLSNREIARRLGIHHRTVARDLAAPAPAPAEETAPDAPDAPTSGARIETRLLHPLDPQTIQDLNVLADPRTGALPAGLLRAIHAAAERRRADWQRATERRLAEPAPASGRPPARAHVAP